MLDIRLIAHHTFRDFKISFNMDQSTNYMNPSGIHLFKKKKTRAERDQRKGRHDPTKSEDN